jgi:serine/threonine protein kinase
LSQGIAYLHERKQLHRDIKPANLLLSHDGVVKVADFGIAKQLDNTVSLAHDFVGTRTYMSPERFEMDDSEVRARGFVARGRVCRRCTGVPDSVCAHVELVMLVVLVACRATRTRRTSGPSGCPSCASLRVDTRTRRLPTSSRCST